MCARYILKDVDRRTSGRRNGNFGYYERRNNHHRSVRPHGEEAMYSYLTCLALSYH